MVSLAGMEVQFYTSETSLSIFHVGLLTLIDLYLQAQNTHNLNNNQLLSMLVNILTTFGLTITLLTD